MIVYSNQTHLIFLACHTDAAAAAINLDCRSQILITDVEKQRADNADCHSVNEFIGARNQIVQTENKTKTVQQFSMAVASGAYKSDSAACSQPVCLWNKCSDGNLG